MGLPRVLSLLSFLLFVILVILIKNLSGTNHSLGVGSHFLMLLYFTQIQSAREYASGPEMELTNLFIPKDLNPNREMNDICRKCCLPKEKY